MRKAYALLSSLRHDVRGVSAVEFGLIAPLLLLMLLGTIELGRAINNDRHFTSATNTAGDLVAREAQLGASSAEAKTNLDSMMLSIKQIMKPYDPATLKLSIFSVKASATDSSTGKVEWSYAYNGGTAPAQCSQYALPANLIPKGGSVIIVDAKYQFKSLFGSYVPGMSPTMGWSEKSYHSPRNSCVDYVKGDNCISKC
jgi:Flp pilus assembly protein TadG